MVGEPRVWADIDKDWLKSYLQEHNLAREFDLDDELVGSQVSWVLNADDWASLRGAWEKQRPVGDVEDDATQVQTGDEPLTATETPPASANLEAAEERLEAVELELVGAAKPDNQLDETKRIHELATNALSHWGAFKELFSSCPDSAGVGAWETLADTPVALLKLGEKLARTQKAEDDRQKQRTERELETYVSRAQNIIAGYYMYCRKHGTAPSLDHLLESVPTMRTGHALDVVREAWRRESERQSSQQG